jgi:PPM family protein phosphatase
MQIKAYGASNVGKVRSANEDSYLIDHERKLYIVADGMGGHQGGGYASSHAVRKIQEEIAGREKEQNSTKPLNLNGEKSPTQIRLRNALLSANELLYQKALEDPSLRGMGTTCTVIQFDLQHVNIAHVGDSRLYLLRDGALKQVSHDHSWVQEQVDSGVLTEEEANSHPLKNIITRSLGHDRDLIVDLARDSFKIGDKFMMCSDGLTNMVADRSIHNVLLAKAPEPAVQELIALALEGGGLDNITAVVVELAE